MTRSNDPCEVCGGHECSYHDVHTEVFACPVCKAEYDEFSPPFDHVVHELMRRADRRSDKRQFAGELADWLEAQAEYAATKSRDFGRGFMFAVTLLRAWHP